MKAAQPTPFVAHCIVGLTRSLADPLVYQSLRHHLIDAFGGDPRVFLLLKSWDTAPKRHGVFPPRAAQDVGERYGDDAARLRLRRALRLLRPSALRFANASDETPAALGLNPRCDISGGRSGSRAIYVRRQRPLPPPAAPLAGTRHCASSLC